MAEHVHNVTIQSLADRIDTSPSIVLTTEEKQAILWAALLLEGNNVKYKVIQIRPE